MSSLVNSFLSFGGGGGGGGGTLPGLIDFVAGTASIGGTPVSISTVVDHPERISGSGLDVSSAFSKLAGDMKTLWLAQTQFTVVIEYEITGSFSDILPFLMINTIGSGGALAIERYPSVFSAFEYDTTGYISTADYSSSVSIEKVALTRGSGSVAMSFNGDAVNNSGPNTPITQVFDDVCLGGSTWFGSSTWPGYIRKLEIYAEQADADLPTLSTP